MSSVTEMNYSLGFSFHLGERRCPKIVRRVLSSTPPHEVDFLSGQEVFTAAWLFCQRVQWRSEAWAFILNGCYNSLRWKVRLCAVKRASSDAPTHQDFRLNMLFSSCNRRWRLPLMNRKIRERHEGGDWANQVDHFGVYLVTYRRNILGYSKGRAWLCAKLR